VRLDLDIDRKATAAQVLDALKFLPNNRSPPANWYADFLAGKFPDDPRYADLFVAVRRFEQLIKNMPVYGPPTMIRYALTNIVSVDGARVKYFNEQWHDRLTMATMRRDFRLKQRKYAMPLTAWTPKPAKSGASCQSGCVRLCLPESRRRRISSRR
jgi:hypothetical protein